MKKAVALNEVKICDEYLNTDLGVESLGKKYHAGKLKIKEILNRNNIQMKGRGKQPLKIDFTVKDWRIKKFLPINGEHYIVFDKRSNFSTTDIDNLSGILTSYIEKTYKIPTPTLYDRRKYYMETGNYWWEQWLSVKSVKNVKTKKCPYCNWETIDIENKSGAFIEHLKKSHNKTKIEYLQEHPEDIDYFTTSVQSINRQFETNSDNYVVCKICGRKLARIDTHHLKIHGISKLDYIKKYGVEGMSSLTYHKKQSQACTIVNTNTAFTKSSKDENEIKKYITDKGIFCKTDRHVLNGKEIDIFIPSKKIGIEYNGNKWHTEWYGGKDKNYHLDKLKEAKKKNIHLITIFEDEYNYHKDIVYNKISHLLHINEDQLPKIYGRKCEIKEIYNHEAKDFLTKYHIQGAAKSTLYIGAFYNENLIGVMSFTARNNLWELTRFASDYNYICCGVGGKLFNFFLKIYKPHEVISFADRRWTLDDKNNVYTKLGFQFEYFTKPNYTYYNSSVDRYKRFHKFNFRKNRILKKYPDMGPNLTETEMAKSLGFDRIWDCGLIKYVYKNPNYNNE